MTLAAGSKLGPYEIVSAIGAGGMGEVYRRFTCSGIWRRHRRSARGHALDRAPDSLAALRSRGASRFARLLPPAFGRRSLLLRVCLRWSGRETPRAASERCTVFNRVTVEQLDHLVYAVPDLEKGIEQLEAKLGVRAAVGGRHVGEGTRNALIGLGKGAYLEILSPDPGQPLPARPLWLGLEGLSRPRLTAWAVKARGLDDEAARARMAGVRLGPVEEGGRKLPDGRLLSWKFTDPHIQVADGLVPFLIDWGTSPHPSATAPQGITLLALRAEHPNPAGVRPLVRALGLNLPVTKGPRAALIAGLETPKGFVELR